MIPLRDKLDLLGSIAGVLGSGICLLSGLLRLIFGAGNPYGLIIAPRNILRAGIAVLAVACWVKLSSRAREDRIQIGPLVGIFGTSVCAIAVVLRFVYGTGNLTGLYVAPRNILMAGIAIVVFACWLELTFK